MKLWQKDDSPIDEKIEHFTVGNDRELDLLLAPFDVLGSLAHARMLASVHLLSPAEGQALETELRNIYREIAGGKFQIEAGVEDVHSQIERLLTQRLGDTGKKIHSGRSRNDQVLTAIKLFLRDQLRQITETTGRLIELLLTLSEQHKAVLLPGYTHLQVAMPSSFGLWFGAWAESLTDDLRTVKAAYELANRNPLGSGAGYGSSFPLNRTLTTELLGFAGLHYNVVYAQLSRGKAEHAVLTALAALATTLNRLATDVCLYNSQNFGFLTLPDALTTGSSIMPHKKNPDVAELLRGRTNRLRAKPGELALLLTNLPSGYHREMQLTKDITFPACAEMHECLAIAHFMLENLAVNPAILSDERYRNLFSVERVNELVVQGVPFRDAYVQVGREIAAGTLPVVTELHHTHEGSLGNLMNDSVRAEMQNLMAGFGFERAEQAVRDLVG